jgi:predicted metal-dependent hydrolase
MSSADPRYLKGVDHFNARNFYDAHEVWEELWHTLQKPEADFVQGLIQYATALHHFRAGNLKGVHALMKSGTDLLRPLGKEMWGLPIDKLVADMSACTREVMARDVMELPSRYDPHKHEFPVKINESAIPTIQLRIAQ